MAKFTGDNLANIIHGTLARDNIWGLRGNDGISGDNGNDFIYGGAGNDAINGGNGDDVISGGKGNDSLDGGVGADTVSGGDGNDTYVIDNVSDQVIEKASHNGGHDTIHSTLSATLPRFVEDLYLHNMTNTNLDGTGNNSANYIEGTSGNNTLRGEGGNDTLVGGEGNDRLFGGDGDDVLHGQDGSLTAFDFLSGGKGNDLLVGEFEHYMRMTGGAGEDTFDLFFRGDMSETIVITDFTGGQDLIDLSNVIVFGNFFDDFSFTYIGEQLFSADATGQLRFDPLSQRLLGSIDADSKPELYTHRL